MNNNPPNLRTNVFNREQIRELENNVPEALQTFQIYNANIPMPMAYPFIMPQILNRDWLTRTWEGFERNYDLLHPNRDYRGMTLTGLINKIMMRDWQNYDIQSSDLSLYSLFYLYFLRNLLYKDWDKIFFYNIPHDQRIQQLLPLMFSSCNRFSSKTSFAQSFQLFFANDDYFETLLDSQDHTEVFLSSPLAGSEYNLHALREHNLISFELYHFFLIFFQKILFQSYAQTHQDLVELPDLEDVSNPNGLYMKFYPLYLNCVQNFSYRLYKHLIKSRFFVGKSEVIKLPKELGSLLYLTFNKDDLRPEFFNEEAIPNLPNVQNFSENYQDDLIDYSEDFQNFVRPSLKITNANLLNLLRDYFFSFYHHSANENILNSSFELVFSFYSRHDRQDQENQGGYYHGNIIMLFGDIFQHPQNINNIRQFDTFWQEVQKRIFLAIENAIIERLQAYEDDDILHESINTISLVDKTYKFIDNPFYKIEHFYSNVSIVLWRFLGYNSDVNQMKKALRAFHNSNLHFKSWCDIYIPPTNKENCILFCLGFLLFTKLKLIRGIVELPILNYFLQFHQQSYKKICKYLDNGKICKLIEWWNKQFFSIKIMLYIFTGNCLLYTEHYLTKEKNEICYFLLYKNNLGIISFDKLEQLRRFRDQKKFEEVFLPKFELNINDKKVEYFFKITPVADKYLEQNRKDEKFIEQEENEIESIIVLDEESHLFAKKEISKNGKITPFSKNMNLDECDKLTLQSDILSQIEESNNCLDNCLFFKIAQEKLKDPYENEKLSTNELYSIGDFQIEFYDLYQRKNEINDIKKQLKITQKRIKKMPKNINKKKKKEKDELGDKIIWGWDIETIIFDKITNKFEAYCICVFSEDEEKTFWGRNCVWDFCKWLDILLLEDEFDKHYFYSFNGSRFDNMFFIIKFFYWFMGNTMILGNLTNIKAIIIKERLNFYDFRLLMNGGSLNKISESLLGKKKKEFDIKSIIYDENKWIQHKEEIITYCLYDAQLVYELVLNQHEFFDLFFSDIGKSIDGFNIFCPTISLLALNLWKQIVSNSRLIEGVHSIEEYTVLKNSYKGGMCLPLKKYFSGSLLTPMYHYDIVSSYPAVMKNNAMPIRKRSQFIYDPPYQNGIIYKFTEYCLYKVRFQFRDKIIFPYFPLRTKQGLIYVQQNLNDKECAWIWGHELIYACQHDHLQKLILYEHWLYTTELIFNEYISLLFEERLKAISDKNEIKKFWLKILMNSLYGKFGQKQYDKIDLIHGSELNEYLSFFSKGNDRVQKTKSNLESKNFLKNVSIVEENIENYPFFQFKYNASTNMNWIGSCISISSYIASKARIKLVEGIFLCGQENVYYFDTDSLFSVNELPNLKIGSNLGDWKCEEDDIIKAYFLAPKVYCFQTNDGKEVLHCKGIPTNLLKWQDFEDMKQKKQFTYKINQQFIHKNHEIFIKENLEKTLKFLDLKRYYFENGNSRSWKDINEMEEHFNK